MQAVAQSSSETVLRLVDRLISEGHSPTHFARQMVRFLRNTVVAKIAGGDSSLLQISGDERARVARVAALFSEEDLARHLQIMLRTHGELGYRQEQRFHLELGLLKMSHAQRLLPIEELLSAAGLAGASNQRAGGRPMVVPEQKKTESPVARGNPVSPFAADSARKGGPRQESSGDTFSVEAPRMVGSGNTAPRVIMSAAAPVEVSESGVGIHLSPRLETEVEVAASAVVPTVSPGALAVPIEKLQAAVIQALMDGNQRILVSMLGAGEWSVEGNEVVIRVSESQTVVDMSLSADARRVAIASASGVLGRAVKLKIVPGATVATTAGKRNGASKTGAAGSGPGGRSRAEQDSVVRRLQEKFGAEIRTVIDYKEKR